MVNYNPSGDSQIIKTLKENHSFPGAIQHREEVSKQFRQTLIMYSSCNR